MSQLDEAILSFNTSFQIIETSTVEGVHKETWLM